MDRLDRLCAQRRNSRFQFDLPAEKRGKVPCKKRWLSVHEIAVHLGVNNEHYFEKSMRPATPSDIERIVETLLPEMEAGHFEKWPPAECARFFERSIAGGVSGPTGKEVRTWIYVYEIENRFAGFAVVRDKPKSCGSSHYPDNTKEFWMLAMRSDVRGGGHGTHFAQEVIQQHPGQHLIALCKAASQKMMGILRRLRFVELAQYRDGEKETLFFLDISGATEHVKAKLQTTGVFVVRRSGHEENRKEPE